MGLEKTRTIPAQEITYLAEAMWVRKERDLQGTFASDSGSWGDGGIIHRNRGKAEGKADFVGEDGFGCAELEMHMRNPSSAIWWVDACSSGAPRSSGETKA